MEDIFISGSPWLKIVLNIPKPAEVIRIEFARNYIWFYFESKHGNGASLCSLDVCDKRNVSAALLAHAALCAPKITRAKERAQTEYAVIITDFIKNNIYNNKITFNSSTSLVNGQRMKIWCFFSLSSRSPVMFGFLAKWSGRCGGAAELNSSYLSMKWITLYHDFGAALMMGAHVLESNSSGNLTPAVTETGAVLPGYLLVMLSVLMVTLVVVVVAGNALVIMAFVVDKTLRTQSNYFFLNLAISDFLVGESAQLLLCVSSSQCVQIQLLFFGYKWQNSPDAWFLLPKADAIFHF